MAVDVDLGALLDEGCTLPATWYSDPEVWALEKERIFARTWQFVGPVAWVEEHGAYFAARAGHIPVVVVRDGDEVRAFVNVCRHRAHLVVQGRGQRNSLQCPYHAWTFGLDGCLERAAAARRGRRRPARRARPAPAPLRGLRPRRVRERRPRRRPARRRARHDPREHRGERHRPRDARAAPLRRLGERRDNWKNTIENYLECYHCPVAHPGFSQAIDVRPDVYELETGALTMSQRGAARHEVPERLLPAGAVEVAQYHLLFPTTSIDIVPGPPNLTIYAWNPTGPHSMAATAHYFFDATVSEADVEQIVAFNGPGERRPSR